MDNSLYIALSKQGPLFNKMAVIANNLANSNTAGYKEQQMMFSIHPENSGSPNAPNNHKLDFVKDISTPTKFTAGHFEKTGNPLDVAIQGDGFFAVETPLGTRYTRAGDFQLNSKGELATKQGFPVLSPGNQRVTFGEEDNIFLIREDGTVAVKIDGQLEPNDIGQIGVFQFKNNQLLNRVGDTMFESAAKPVAADPNSYKTVQGLLENSNVNPIKATTDLVEITRSFTAGANFIRDSNDLARDTIRTILRPN